MNDPIAQLLADNDRGMLAGRHRRAQRLRAIRRQENSHRDPAALVTLRREIEESLARRELRLQSLPPIKFDDDLPIAGSIAEIDSAIRTHRVIVVTGETGSGKSTQLPLILLQAGLGIDGWIGHTQPRRIAARSIASRIAAQLQSPLGRFAGYKVRFDDRIDEGAYIKLMTDGILLAELQSDRFLNAYSALIVDEAHERSLNIDFLLGRLKQLSAVRSDLRIVITSATIDAEKFARHFQDSVPVPVIEVSGRGYPVEIRYQAGRESSADAGDDAILQAIGELMSVGSGDILVFQPTEYEIRSLARQLRGFLTQRGDRDTEILPLYARLTTEQQNAVFAPHRRRRIVIATNVAESSITVPGIRFVVDSGTARISRYAPRSRVQRLPIEAISKASADQRAGRCGRVGPGICIRTYDRDDYESRPPYTTPEIRRTNLASVILQTLSQKMGDVASFPFIDPPSKEAIRDGYDTLFELNAIDEDHALTDIGRQLSRIPTDPRVARLMLAANEMGCLTEVTIIAAGLEVQDPRLRPAERQQQADQRHAQWLDPHSDFMSLLALFDFFHRLKGQLSRSRLARACQDNFLSLTHLRQWADVHRQLREMGGEMKWRFNPRREEPFDLIHQSLLSGFLSGIAMQTQRGQYLGAQNLSFQLWPGSGLINQPPKWLLVAEIVETSRRYGRTAARIQPQWIEPLAGHLLEHHYSDPHWSDRSQRCLANERITLYGLTIASNRTVPYAPIDRAVARDLFIQEGLVAGRIKTRVPFFQHNQQLRDRALTWAKKTRDRKWIIDDWQIHRFYAERLPADIFDTASLEQAVRRQPDLVQALTMQWEALCGQTQPPPETDFPEQLDIGAAKLPLTYRFEPGAADDGVSIEIPADALGHLTQSHIDWFIPGRIVDRIEELIRSLPKSIRRSLVPARQTAEKVAAIIRFGKENFYSAVAGELSRMAESRISPDDFKLDKLAPHFHFNIRAIDRNGTVVAAGRELDEVKRSLGVDARDSTAHTSPADSNSKWHRDQIVAWDFGDLPETVVEKRGGVEIAFFPTLVDQGDSVSLRLVDSMCEAEWQRHRAIARLVQLKHRKAIRTQRQHLPGLDSATLTISPWVSQEAFHQGIEFLLARLASSPVSTTRAQAEFLAALNSRLVGELSTAVQSVAIWLKEMSEPLHAVRLILESSDSISSSSLGGELIEQLGELFSKDFLVETPWDALERYPVYLAAMVSRMEKAKINPARDEQSASEVRRQWQRFVDVNSRSRPGYPIDDRLSRIRWMIEELRVSLFAQQLGTRYPISVNRIEKVWREINA